MKTITTLIAAALMATSAQGALIQRLGGQAVYDTDLNITWLANANLAKTETFGVANISADGTMNWITAHYGWLPALNAANYLGFDDWRFPATLHFDLTCSHPNPPGNPDPRASSVGSGCTGSEMGHLFYDELGGVAGQSILTSADPDVALFENFELTGSQLGIWSGFCCLGPGANASEFAYYFGFDGAGGGFQAAGPKTAQSTPWVGWVVRDGDVLAAPEPGTLALLMFGLSGIGVAHRRQRNQ